MNRDNNRRREGEDEGWGSMLFKVASAAAATAAVAGGIYALLKQPSEQHKPEVAFGARAVPVPNHNRGEADENRKVWTKPEAGWVKLNVDGSLLPQSAGCGGVLRNHYGEWVGGFAKKLSPHYKVDETEKMAILEGLRWARERGERKVKVESDNEGVVGLVNREPGYNDPRIIRDIRELLLLKRDDWQAELTWIQSDANQVADKVAHNAHSLQSFALHEFDSSPPLNCILALSKDSQ